MDDEGTQFSIMQNRILGRNRTRYKKKNARQTEVPNMGHFQVTIAGQMVKSSL